MKKSFKYDKGVFGYHANNPSRHPLSLELHIPRRFAAIRKFFGLKHYDDIRIQTTRTCTCVSLMSSNARFAEADIIKLDTV